MQLVMQHLDVPRWNGLRVVAANGSKMRMFLKDVTRRAVRDVVAFVFVSPWPGNDLVFPTLFRQGR